MNSIDKNKLNETLNTVRDRLVGSMTGDSNWQGRLSSSALATATAITAISLGDKSKYKNHINAGFQWLVANANNDGGWGDTPVSESNISTTVLCWAAFAMGDDPDRYEQAVANAESWLLKRAGGLDPSRLAEAVYQKYGEDRTFAIPILTMCAISGRLGDNPWPLIKPLAFELAIFPHGLYKWLRLSVVSYALAALIAIGQVHFHHVKPKNPFVRLLRFISRRQTLSKLARIQPDNGGFLEAVTLTSFVVMSLIESGHRDNIVTVKGVDFIVDTVREDGSWPIDTNLATWVTTLSVNALSIDPDFANVLPVEKRKAIRKWLLNQQYHHVHPYVHAPPGGWAWTDAPGGVPDADDSAGALIALRNLDLIDDKVVKAACMGVNWLIGLQNRDGGIPTFCTGWKDMPFDRSAPDLTAHAIAAMSKWIDVAGVALAKRCHRSIALAITYLANSQRADGSWVPLWFGNEAVDYKQNPVYGTAKVMIGLLSMPDKLISTCAPMLANSAVYLMSVQNEDGGWGGAKGVRSTIEETSLAVDALACFFGRMPQHQVTQRFETILSKGVNWLIDRFASAQKVKPSPIGLYFASLWYHEDMYPWIFATAALERASNIINAN